MAGGNEPCHPRSRKAKQIQRKEHRKEKLSTQYKQRRKAKFLPEVEKVRWFKLHTTEETLYSDGDARQLITLYIEEKVNELEELKLDPKKNLWKCSALQTIIDRETKLFEEGKFSAPDILAKKILRNLHTWDGYNPDYLKEIRMKNYKKAAIEHDPSEVITMPK